MVLRTNFGIAAGARRRHRSHLRLGLLLGTGSDLRQGVRYLVEGALQQRQPDRTMIEGKSLLASDHSGEAPVSVVRMYVDFKDLQVAGGDLGHLFIVSIHLHAQQNVPTSKSVFYRM